MKARIWNVGICSDKIALAPLHSMSNGKKILFCIKTLFGLKLFTASETVQPNILI